MTEYNIFCYSKEYNDQSSFQQSRYRAFNKSVGKTRYNEIVETVNEIIGTNDGVLLADFWKKITQEQWQQLLSIPEASDFKEGFEYISGQKIVNTMSGKTVEVIIDGKTYTAKID